MILQMRFLFLIAWAASSVSCVSSDKNVQAVSALATPSMFSSTTPTSNVGALASAATSVKAESDPYLIVADSLMLQESADFPTKINAVVSSYDCRLVAEILREQNANEFQIELRSADASAVQTNCKRQEHNIPLPLSGLSPGSYTVKIHNLQQTFELYSEQIANPPQLHG